MLQALSGLVMQRLAEDSSENLSSLLCIRVWQEASCEWKLTGLSKAGEKPSQKWPQEPQGPAGNMFCGAPGPQPRPVEFWI